MLREIVYLNRTNTFDFVLKAKRLGETQLAAVDLSGTTKMEIIIDEITISSLTSPDAFDWSEHGADTEEDERRLILALGDEGLDAGSYVAQLIVYDVDNLAGVMWDHVNIVVRESG